MVSGAGPTGVEIASELANAYGGEKDITLIIGGERALQASHVLLSVSQAVERDLQNLAVKVARDTRLEGVETKAMGEEDAVAQTTLTLSDSSTVVANLYLPLFSVQVNTSLAGEGAQVTEYKPSGRTMIFITMGKRVADQDGRSKVSVSWHITG